MPKMGYRKGNRIEIDGDTARIWDRHGHYTLVDAADVPLVSRYTWTYDHNHGYWLTSMPRAGVSDAEAARHPPRWRAHRIVRLHRLLLDAPESGIDHANRDKSDNRRSNLRLCTPSESARNRGGTGPYAYKGIVKQESGWAACVMVDRQAVQWGNYATIGMAACRYDLECPRLHGAFASPNTVDLADWLDFCAFGVLMPYDRDMASSIVSVWHNRRLDCGYVRVFATPGGAANPRKRPSSYTRFSIDEDGRTVARRAHERAIRRHGAETCDALHPDLAGLIQQQLDLWRFEAGARSAAPRWPASWDGIGGTGAVPESR